MSLPRFGLASAFVRRWMPWLLAASSTGCLSQNYEIAAPELQRIVALAPEERGTRVRVTQQTAFGNDTSEVSSELDAADWALLVASRPSHHAHYRYEHHRRDDAADDADDTDADDDATDDVDADSAEAALAVALVALAAAATAAVTVGVTEGVRFDGWVHAPGAHPVLLIDTWGERRWARLETLTADEIRGVDRAVLPDYAGDLELLERHPLDRRGFVYQLELGAEAAAFEGASLALSARGGLGYMPSQRYGFLLGAAFASAEADHAPRPQSSDTRLAFDHRLFLQIEAWPLASGRWHLGPYAELGLAWARADHPLGTRSAEGWMLGLGAALQLEWSTRLAMTLRAGVAGLPSAEPSTPASSGYRLAPSLTLGFGIY
jgi:hypothetical protein